MEGGAGPVSNRIAVYTWKFIRTIGRKHSRILSLAGPVILTLTLVGWILLLWLGWLLLFMGGDQAVIDTQDNLPTELRELVYFTGFTVFTLGVGDYVPKEGPWQVATAIASGNGMLFITLGVTYILSILGAVTTQRSFASGITGIGQSGHEVAGKAWNGQDFRDIDLLLNSAISQLGTLASQHRAFPILHYYHSLDLTKAASIGVTVLDEALTILEFGVPETHQSNRFLLEDTRSGIKSYLEALPAKIDGSESSVPPHPNLAHLREKGLPTVADEKFLNALDKLNDRRKSLYSLVKLDARPWPDGKDEEENSK
ncbi:ion channel [Planococcus lenghuensis]|uniref:ion channel n=1 Tax=Planococcus lenghuensis TaxID=2213202 RepID=UPI0012ECADC9|nr:ion channel [Planococcus lenghuensis]